MAANDIGIRITAHDATATATRGVVQNLQTIKSAAAGINGLLAGIGAGVSVGAFVTLTKSVIDGIDALNDLKDATGASIENISALEDVARRSGASMATVSTALVKLNQALSAAKPGSDTEAAIKAIGLSVKDLKALDPAEAFQRIAIGLNGYADDANKARLVQELFGKSLKEVAPLLKDLAEKGTLNATVTTAQAEAAEKFNKQLAGMQTDINGAVRALVQQLIPAISAVSAEFSNGIKYAGGFGSAMQLIGTTNPFNSLSENLKKYRDEVDELTGDIERYKRANADTRGLEQALNVAKKRLEYFKAMQRHEIDSSEMADASDAISRRMTIGKPGLPDTTGGSKTGTKTVSEAAKGLALYNDLMEKASGLDKTWAEDTNKLRAALDARTISQTQFNAAVQALYANQPAATAAAKADADARLEAARANTAAVDEQFDAQEKQRLATEDQIKTGRTLLEQIEFETALLGLNAEQRAQATLERELEAQGIIKGTVAYEAYIVKLREATAIKAAKESGIQATQDLADANRKAAEESSKYWEDALMRAFESGKGFFESLWDTIKNTLKTQVLKVLVSGVMGGGATSALAGDGSALGALGSLSGLSNLYTGVSNLVGIGGQVFAGTMSAANALGTVAANATGTGISGLLATNGAYGTAGGVAGSAGSMFAAAAPWLAGAAALYAIAQATKGETRAGGQYGYSMDGTTAANVRRGTTVAASGIGATYLEGPSGGDPYASDVSNAINSTVLHINSLLSAVGSKAALTGFQAAYETSENDRGGVLAGGTLSTGALFGESGRGDNYAGTLYDSSKGFNLDAKAAVTALSLDLKQATIEALQAAGDMPQAIADMIKVEAKTLTDEAATAILTSIDALVTDTNALRGALNNLPFAYLRDMSFDTAAGLIKAAGGLQALDASLSGYYENFYSETEKTANLTRNVTAALAAQNIVMPAVNTNLREWYRGEVERLGAMDLSIEANAKAYASILSLQGSVALLADGADTAAQKIAEAAAALRESLIAAQDDALGELASAINDQRGLLQESVAAQAQAAQDAANAIRDALAGAGQGIAAFIKSILQGVATPDNLAANYRKDLVLAQGGDVDASQRLPESARAYLSDAVGRATTAAEAARITGRMAAELSNLPATKSYEQQLLEAVQGTTAAVGATTDAIKAANSKITAELTVQARSEIVKLISFVTNTDALPAELKELALATSSTFAKTVSFVAGSSLPDDLKQLALADNTTLTRTLNLALGSATLDDDTKSLALLATGSVSRTIALAATSLISPEQQALALATTSSITKQINFAVGEADPLALGIAYAQSSTINRIITVSGGDLSADQEALLSAIDTYNKTVNIDVVVSSDSLTAFQQLLMTTFGTIDISQIGNSTGLGGVDLTSIISQGALDRLNSIATYINTLDWSPANSNASAWATYDAARVYGVTQQDLANATGYTYGDIVALFDRANIPRFAMGTNYLPTDMLAQVHAGERIVPAADNRELMSRLRDPQENSAALVGEIKALREENRAQAKAMVAMQQRMTKLMERWDGAGMPEVRVV